VDSALQGIIDAVTKSSASLNNLCVDIFSYIAKGFSIASWSADLVKFILQFIPPPVLVMLNIELIFAISGWFQSIYRKVQTVVRLPGF